MTQVVSRMLCCRGKDSKSDKSLGSTQLDFLHLAAEQGLEKRKAGDKKKITI